MNKLHRMGLAATAAAASLALLPGTANATPSSGVSATVLFQRTVGEQDYILREITVEPGGSTGWHYHEGTLYGVIRKGTLSHFRSTCESDGVYEAGQAIVEPSGSDHVHIGQNRGDKPVVMEVLYVIPHGAPLSVDAPNPGCEFQ
ncbi:cupin domain-containing protein [Nonomuraea sp. JJY05]|jgi:quercetin dioxygenase-like cupin family protein|uniref:cupin domain-containing protein n=1 Tax=Nonomuraea sp. JJY05 TaxID=3350255 RepID=UPI00373EBCBE